MEIFLAQLYWWWENFQIKICTFVIIQHNTYQLEITQLQFFQYIFKKFGSLMIFFQKLFFSFLKFCGMEELLLLCRIIWLSINSGEDKLLLLRMSLKEKGQKYQLRYYLIRHCLIFFFILRHISQIIFCQKLYSFYLLGKLSLRATQSL